jgi:translation initiation factor 4E
MWEHKANTGSKDPEKWKENMKQLCAFDTVEDFWRYSSHLPRPSEVFFDGECRKKVVDDSSPEGKTVEEYSLFKKGIEPEWGDPKNVTGGEWFCRQYLESDVLDLYWQNLIMGCISETIEDAIDEEGTLESHINGARVVDKSRQYPLYKLELWVNTRDPVIKERIRNKLMEVVTDGQPPSKRMQPKWDWKDHS